jgi:hypothetical protein
MTTADDDDVEFVREQHGRVRILRDRSTWN